MGEFLRENEKRKVCSLTKVINSLKRYLDYYSHNPHHKNRGNQIELNHYIEWSKEALEKNL